VQTESEPAYALARPAEQIRIEDVHDALRCSAASGALDFGEQARLAAVAARPWHALDDELARSPANRTLRELVDEAPR
jgi:DNA-binding IscR family transcriptional regulator